MQHCMSCSQEDSAEGEQVASRGCARASTPMCSASSSGLSAVRRRRHCSSAAMSSACNPTSKSLHVLLHLITRHCSSAATSSVCHNPKVCASTPPPPANTGTLLIQRCRKKACMSNVASRPSE